MVAVVVVVVVVVLLSCWLVLTLTGSSTAVAWYFLILSNTVWSAQPPSEPYL